MGVDKSYGSGYKNTGMSKATVSKQKLAKAPKSVTPAKRKTATALLAKNRADLAISRSPNRNTPAAPMIGELSKMLTGVGTDASGKFSIDPVGLAMALPLGKLLRISRGLKATESLLGNSVTRNKLRTQATQIGYSISAKKFGQAAAKNIAKSSVTPKMGQKAAQDLYESTSEFIRSGRISKQISKSMQLAAYRPTISKPPINNFRLASANAGKSIKGEVRQIKKAIPPKERYTRADKLNDYFAGYPTRKPRNSGGR